MKQVKKWLALLLTVAMVLGLTACGGDKSAVSGTVTKPDEEETVSGTVQPAEEPEEAEDENIDVGSVVGGTYENTYLGIGCTLDSNWTYASQEEMAQMNELSAENFTDEELKEAIKNSDTFYDMYAMSSDGMAMLQVVFENLGVLYGAVLDEDAYVEILVGSLEEAYTDLGASDISVESTTRSLWGADRPVLVVSCSVNDVAIYQKMAVIKAGSHMATVSVNSYTADITDTLLDLFYEIQ